MYHCHDYAVSHCACHDFQRWMSENHISDGQVSRVLIKQRQCFFAWVRIFLDFLFCLSSSPSFHFKMPARRRLRLKSDVCVGQFRCAETFQTQSRYVRANLNQKHSWPMANPVKFIENTTFSLMVVRWSLQTVFRSYTIVSTIELSDYVSECTIT